MEVLNKEGKVLNPYKVSFLCIQLIWQEAYQFLKNAIAHFSVGLALLDGWVTLTDKGVYFYEQKEEISKETNAESDRIIAKSRDIDIRGKNYLAKLVTYMNRNIDEFAPFRDDDDVVKMDSDTSSSVGQIKGAFGV